MASSDAFHEKLVIIDLSASSSESAIRVLGESLFKNGYVTDAYTDAVLEREREFPTGLPTKPFGVALPHADCEHVYKTGIAVGLLSNPVEFHVMGSPHETIEVRLIFLMAIREPKEQIKTLQRLAQLLENSDALEGLVAIDRPSEVVETLKSGINESAKQSVQLTG